MQRVVPSGIRQWSSERTIVAGCGLPHRLRQAGWRSSWRRLGGPSGRIRGRWPSLYASLPNREDTFVSVMAGGDHALIRSVEGFEDSTDLGRYQLKEAGVGAGDVVVAVTEGGETSLVIGTAWQGLEAGARVFFAYNNPTEVLREHVARSREVIDEPRITKLDLFTGSMAIAGSTRMQATTSELLAIGGALELALLDVLGRWAPPEVLRPLGLPERRAEDYPRIFAELLEQLRRRENLEAIAGLIQWEEGLYRKQGLVTYMTDRFLLDVLTDTTERAPTFRLPPFRKCDDAVSARSWAFVKNPCCGTPEAWFRVLQREPRGIDWPMSVYESLNVVTVIRNGLPRLNNAEIAKFLIGNERDPSRFEANDSGLAMILVGDEITRQGPSRDAFDASFAAHAPDFARTAAIGIGPDRPDRQVETVFHVVCNCPTRPCNYGSGSRQARAQLMSTATMVRIGRVDGNYMSHVDDQQG